MPWRSLGRVEPGSHLAGDLDHGDEVAFDVGQNHRGVVQRLLSVVAIGDVGRERADLSPGNLELDLHRLVVLGELAVFQGSTSGPSIPRLLRWMVFIIRSVSPDPMILPGFSGSSISLGVE